jgi:hypothetical protein
MQQRLFKAFLIFTTFTLTNVKVSSQTTKIDKNCGCDYLPLCSYTTKKTFEGKTYYGINGSEKSAIFYNCENGIITKRWTIEEEVYAGRNWEYRAEINRDGYVDYYGKEKKVFTEAILKFNAKIGETWGNNNSNWRFTILKKGLQITYKGKKYNDIIVVRSTFGNPITKDEYLSEDYDLKKSALPVFYNGRAITQSYTNYWAKNEGFIFSENGLEILRSEVKQSSPSLPLTRAEKKWVTNTNSKNEILLKWSGVYKLIQSSNEPIEYLIIKPGSGVAFITGKYDTNKQLIFSSPCSGTFDFQGNLYQHKVFITNCQNEKIEANCQFKDGNPELIKIGEKTYSFADKEQSFKLDNKEDVTL